MDRRHFLLTALAGAVAAPLGAGAQQAGKVYRVGLIFSNSPVSEMAGPQPVHPLARAFMQSLQALGYVEERNLILERRSAEGHFELFEAIVAELVRLKADVIVTVNDPMTRAAKAVTTTVPIVMTSSIDPVGAGAAQSLARPGGNVTGLAVTTSPEVEAKRLRCCERRCHEPLALRTSTARRRRAGTLRGDGVSRKPRWVWA